MSDSLNYFKIQDRARVRIKALLLVAIFAIAALLILYFMIFKNEPIGSPSPEKILSESDKLRILDELERTSVSRVGVAERQKILDQLVSSGSKREVK